MNGDEKDYNHSSYCYVGLSTEIKSGESKSFSIKTEGEKNIEIAAFNLNGTFHAISSSCIHKGGPLSKGVLHEEICKKTVP